MAWHRGDHKIGTGGRAVLAQAQKIALSNNKPFLLMVASALPYRVD